MSASEKHAHVTLTQQHSHPAQTFVSLLIRPLVCPEVLGYCEAKTMEIRFFAPGGLVSNLDFVVVDLRKLR